MSGGSGAAPDARWDRLVEALRAGEERALARAITVVENEEPGFEGLLDTLHAGVGRAHRIGVTGPPGAGKSTLVTGLARLFRDRGERVGVLAVDPSSPFTGGALLGDRIRMSELATEPAIFIRSMASRGSLGGLSAAARAAADLMDAFGFERVLLETVGVGQSELEIATSADSTVLVLVPESGDGVQTMKAGLMEVADVYAVNKADRPGADRLKKEIEVARALAAGSALGGAGEVGGGEPPVGRWEPPVVLCVATGGEGVARLAAALDAHLAWLRAGGGLEARRRTARREQARTVLSRAIERRARALWEEWAAGAEEGPGAEDASPYALARRLLARAWPGEEEGAARGPAQGAARGSAQGGGGGSPDRPERR